jgi:cell division protein FtsI (penicillin-binding protein 3)
LFALLIIGRAAFIQQVEGPQWRAMAKRAATQRSRDRCREGVRFTAEDGNMLSTSIPYFDIYIDFAADGLRAKNGKIFKDNVDSLSQKLAMFYKDKSSKEYKKQLQQGYSKKNRYFLLRKNIPFKEYKVLRTFPLLKLDPNKGGFIAEVKTKRLTPFRPAGESHHRIVERVCGSKWKDQNNECWAGIYLRQCAEGRKRKKDSA